MQRLHGMKVIVLTRGGLTDIEGVDSIRNGNGVKLAVRSQPKP